MFTSMIFCDLQHFDAEILISSQLHRYAYQSDSLEFKIWLLMLLM